MTTLAHRQRVLDHATDLLAGKRLIADQIRRELADACAAAIQLRHAEQTGDLAELQAMATAIHKHTQATQTLAHSLANDIARHRNRHPRITP